MIYPGDFVSYYLALAYRNDPTPIRMIDLLKSRLASWGDVDPTRFELSAKERILAFRQTLALVDTPFETSL